MLDHCLVMLDHWLIGLDLWLVISTGDHAAEERTGVGPLGCNELEQATRNAAQGGDQTREADEPTSGQLGHLDARSTEVTFD